MRKHLLLIACFVAFIGAAKAQNELEEYAGQYINIKNPCLLELGMDFFYFSLLPKTFIIFAGYIKTF